MVSIKFKLSVKYSLVFLWLKKFRWRRVDQYVTWLTASWFVGELSSKHRTYQSPPPSQVINTKITGIKLFFWHILAEIHQKILGLGGTLNRTTSYSKNNFLPSNNSLCVARYACLSFCSCFSISLLASRRLRSSSFSFPDFPLKQPIFKRRKCWWWMLANAFTLKATAGCSTSGDQRTHEVLEYDISIQSTGRIQI